MKPARRQLRGFFALATAAALSGCSTYEEDSRAVLQNLRAGDYAAAALVAKSAMQEAPERDTLLWKLEYAAAERAAGHYESSLKAFENAEDNLRKWDDAPAISVSDETVATLVNLSHLPYRGTGYDRIMAATYCAMNALSLGRIDDARVYLTRAAFREDEVRAIAERDIGAAKSDAASGGGDVSKSMSSVRSELSAIYGDLAKYRLYGDHVNPFTVWLCGVFRIATAEGGSDVEYANKFLERASLLTPENAVVLADLATARAMRSGTRPPPLAWIVFETGVGPHLVEERIDIPLFIVSDTVPYAGIALPKLIFNGGHAPSLAVSSGAETLARTETVASMDAVVARDFDNTKTAVITRSIITAGIKAAATYAANKAAKEYMDRDQSAAGSLLYLASIVGTGVANYATTHADLRVWRTLPKAFQIARVPVPADRKIRLTGAGAPQIADIDLPPGDAFLITAKAADAGTPLMVSVTTLRGAAPVAAKTP